MYYSDLQCYSNGIYRSIYLQYGCVYRRIMKDHCEADQRHELESMLRWKQVWAEKLFGLHLSIHLLKARTFLPGPKDPALQHGVTMESME